MSNKRALLWRDPDSGEFYTQKPKSSVSVDGRTVTVKITLSVPSGPLTRVYRMAKYLGECAKAFEGAIADMAEESNG